MSSIDYGGYFNIPPGSRLVIEEIACTMEKHYLIPDLDAEHLMGFPLEPKNLISFKARYGNAFEALYAVCEGRQFQQNLTLMKDLCLVVKELHDRGAIPIRGDYWVGDPRKGQGVSLECELDYKGFRVKMEAVPTAISIYSTGGVITGFEKCEEAIEELVRLTRPLHMNRLQLPSGTE